MTHKTWFFTAGDFKIAMEKMMIPSGKHTKSYGKSPFF